MEQNEFLQKLLPYLGGEANLGRTEQQGGRLFITVKDRGMVDLEALRGLDGVGGVQLTRTRLKVTLQETGEQQEVTMKYETMCKEILEIVGPENLTDAFHCVTRLRLVVKNKEAVNQQRLAKVPGVMQVKTTAGQIQVVIGPQVADVYEEFCKIAHLEQKRAVDEDTDSKDAAKGGSPIAKVLDVLSSIFTPVIPAFSAGGMIKCVSMLLTAFHFLPEESSVITVLNAIGDAPFYFLPFIVAYTTAKRFRLNEVLGLMAAGILLYPTFLQQTEGESLRFLFFDIPCLSYATSVLPAVLSVILVSYVYRLLDKFIPKSVGLVFTGMLAFLLCAPIMLGFLAPLGYNVSLLLGKGMMFLFSTVGPLAGALFAGLLPLLVVAGMHTCLDPVIIQNFSTLGYDYLFPAFLINNIAVAGSTLGASFKIKDPAMKAAAVSNGGLGFLAITEPALYGINVPYKQPLIGSIVGGAVGGALYMLFGVVSYAYTMPSIFSLVSYADGTRNLLWMVVSIAASFAAGFVYSFIFTKDKSES